MEAVNASVALAQSIGASICGFCYSAILQLRLTVVMVETSSVTTLVAVTENSVSLAGSVGCMRYGTVAIPLSVQQPTPVRFYRQKKHINTENDPPS